MNSARRKRVVFITSNSRGPTARGGSPCTLRGLLAPGYFHFFWVAALLAGGCQQKMADQPSYKHLEPNKFFADGRSERPAVPGAIARGHLQTDVALFTGRRAGKNGEPLGAAMPTAIQPPPGSPQAAKAEKAQYDDFVDQFAYPMTKKVLEHGYNRYMIYCVVCHDPLGTGNGKIVERGYTRPPSFHIERLRTVPPGYLFAVITEGYGSMPSYSAQIPVRDRWAIAGYLRALQASQRFPEKGSGGRGQGSESSHLQVSKSPSPPSPHPNPLPKGEGTEQEAATAGGKSP
jgi:hypothetical protein